jgi:GT2 family glycosyltransferase
MQSEQRIGVVIATRNRLSSLLETLARLHSLPERPRVTVVDNASRDRTGDIVGATYPCADVVELSENLGAAARNLGALLLDTPYIAFCDDDSWWQPGSLLRAADIFDAHPRLGLLAAKILVGEERRPDPTCERMGSSRLPEAPDLPGRPVLGFIACGAIVRRSAFLAVDGFSPRLCIGGEERLLALDLARAGWGLAYVDEVVAHHHPYPGPRPVRKRSLTRNSLWVTWLRRRPARAVTETVSISKRALEDREARAGLLDAIRGLPWVLRERRAVPPELDRKLEAISED